MRHFVWFVLSDPYTATHIYSDYGDQYIARLGDGVTVRYRKAADRLRRRCLAVARNSGATDVSYSLTRIPVLALAVLGANDAYCRTMVACGIPGGVRIPKHVREATLKYFRELTIDFWNASETLAGHSSREAHTMRLMIHLGQSRCDSIVCMNGYPHPKERLLSIPAPVGSVFIGNAGSGG